MITGAFHLRSEAVILLMDARKGVLDQTRRRRRISRRCWELKHGGGGAGIKWTGGREAKRRLIPHSRRVHLTFAGQLPGDVDISLLAPLSAP